MRFPAEKLKASGGHLYAHIHENASTGLKRNLFWSLKLNFAPLKYCDSEFQCGMMCEWIPWTARDWRDLDGEQLDVVFHVDGSVLSGPASVEASFYMTSHDQARRVSLKLRRGDGAKFTASMSMIADFHGYDEDDADPNLPVAGEASVDYLGLIIVKGNLFPKPNAEAEAIAAAEQFIDVTKYGPPRDEDWRWVFPPEPSESGE